MTSACVCILAAFLLIGASSAESLLDVPTKSKVLDIKVDVGIDIPNLRPDPKSLHTADDNDGDIKIQLGSKVNYKNDLRRFMQSISRSLKRKETRMQSYYKLSIRHYRYYQKYSRYARYCKRKFSTTKNYQYRVMYKRYTTAYQWHMQQYRVYYQKYTKYFNVFRRQLRNYNYEYVMYRWLYKTELSRYKRALRDYRRYQKIYKKKGNRYYIHMILYRETYVQAQRNYQLYSRRYNYYYRRITQMKRECGCM